MITDEQIGYAILFIGGAIYYIADQLAVHKQLRYLTISEQKDRLLSALLKEVNNKTVLGKTIIKWTHETDFTDTNSVIRLISFVKSSIKDDAKSCQRILGDELFYYFKNAKL